MASPHARRDEWFDRLNRIRARSLTLAKSGHFASVDAIRAALEWEGYGEEETRRALTGMQRMQLRYVIANHREKRFDA